MSPTRTCPRCQTSFSADIIDAQVGGVCPRCLFQLVIGDPGEEATLKASSTSPTVAESAPDLPKHMGNYEILGMLGAGGMGKVYKAKQRGLDRFVAIKVLGGGGQEEIERFFREARASAKLHHPHIIPIHEVVSHEGRYFYAMDFVDGKTLERAVKDGALPLRQGLEILAKTARAIHFAHEHGVVHRDIKPANILLDGKGEPMVADFGLAKDISSEAGLTQSGYLLGTPSYMAPEQAAPDRKAEVDAQSDVYSLGATLYYVLTGRPPHEGRSVYEVIAKVVGNDPAAPRSAKPEIPRDVETICLKALRRDRASRYASAKELAEDLDRYLAGEPILARPVGFVESLALKAKRHRRPILAGVGAAVLALVSLLIFQQFRPAELRIVTQPPGAAVEINGRRLEGLTPMEDVRIPPGKIDVVLHRAGHRRVSRSLTLEPGTRFPLDVTLPRSTGRLFLQATAPGCTATLRSAEGESRELQCPVEGAEIPEGRYSFRLAREDHVDTEGSFTIRENGDEVLLRTVEPRLLGSFRTKELSLRTILFDSQRDNWCVLTQGDRYLWTSTFPDPNPKGFAPVDGIDDLLLMLPVGINNRRGSIALWARTDGSLEATSNFRYDLRTRRWTHAMEDGRVATVVPLAPSKREPQLVVLGRAQGSGSPTTLLHLVTAETGKVLWKTAAPGIRREVRPTPDLDGDQQEDLLVWGDGASILSGATGKLLMTVAEPSLRVLAAGVRPGASATILLATPDGCSALSFPGGERRWASSSAIGAASVLAVDGAADLLLLRDGAVQRLDGATGREVWNRSDVRPRTGEPHVLLDADLDGLGDLVYRDENRLVCISGKDGHSWWSYGLPRLGHSRVVALGSTDFGGRGGKVGIALQSGEFMELNSAVAFEGRELATRRQQHEQNCMALDAGAGRFPDLLLSEGESLHRVSLESGRKVWSLPEPETVRLLLRTPGTGVVLALCGKPGQGTLRAVAEADGRKLWQQESEDDGPESFPVPQRSGPLHLLLAVAGKEGPTLTCREALSGRVIWNRTLTGKSAGISVGDQPGHPVVVILVDRPAVPGLPELNGRAILLAPDDGRTLRTLALCVPGSVVECTLTDLDGDGTPDLVLVSREWAQGVNGKSGRILWMRHLPHLNGQVYARRGREGRELLLSGSITYVLRPRDGTELRRTWGMLVGYPGDLWITVPLSHSWSFSRVDPDTFQILGRAYERGLLRLIGSASVPEIAGGRLFRMGFGQAFEGVGTVHLLPVTFETPAGTTVRRVGPGGTTEVPFDRTDPEGPEYEFPDTARGAAEAFLYSVYNYDGSALHERVILEEGTGWPAPDLVQGMEDGARKGLAQWVLSRPDKLRFTGDLGADIRDVRETGDNATITLSRKIGCFGDTLRARRESGAWKIVLRLTVEDIRRLNRVNTEGLDEVLAALRGICTAEADFKSDERDKDGVNAYWTGDLAGLYHRENAKLILLAVAEADAAPLPSTPRPSGGNPRPYHGYLFRAIPLDPQGKAYALDLNRDGLIAENQRRFAFCAYPAEKPPGRPTFIISEGHSIYVRDTQGKPVDQFPAEPTREGWTLDY